MILHLLLINLKPSGGGYVTTNGAFRVRDTDFTITDDQDSAKEQI